MLMQYVKSSYTFVKKGQDNQALGNHLRGCGHWLHLGGHCPHDNTNMSLPQGLTSSFLNLRSEEVRLSGENDKSKCS